MQITADLKQPEIVAMLASYGIKDLHLTAHENRTYTYRYSEIDMRKVTRMLGEASITSNGKVAVYQVPGVGQIGIAQHADLVRLIDKTERRTSPGNSHLAKTEVTPELHLGFLQAAANTMKRLTYMKKLWTYFNDHKFQGRMDLPTLLTSPKPPFKVSKSTRGAYLGGAGFAAGQLWMAEFMFNAREEFFLEVFLHEMCHQAVWNVDRIRDRTEAGHGPDWQRWMKHVGLDPRRFDPTDDTEYKIGFAKDQVEEDRAQKFGPPTPSKDLKRLHKMDLPTTGPVLLYREGRLFDGHLSTTKKVFDGTAPNGRHYSWKFKTLNGLDLYHKGK